MEDKHGLSTDDILGVGKESAKNVSNQTQEQVKLLLTQQTDHISL
jgi:hypothetical protein